ncbi:MULTISPECIES: ABC transporter permease [Marinobacter]|jgi:putative ABC transport system permease protein|uniref:ABC transporter permease n=2 Tax=Marinobacter TaxID=2742 RepID=A0A1M2UY08_MARNT|nr:MULTISPECIES: ABC transporter permease [Marinobacter]MDX5440193.1 ABC transporter permease [Alteromonadaceae bacterium]WBU39668.1 ABC transporter permease [Marinobacter alkaliphilus]MAO12914.1 ABC transporter permease [Marinobacter sp.]OJT00228.1 ABC transporter permease [Marinobacter nauticus]BBJ04317.1 ABC transporter permease [Marinobacter nauticus]
MLSEIAFYGALETGLIYGLVAFGIYLSFRVLDFPDLTVDGSFPLGAAVAAVLILEGWNPWVATGFAALAGMAAGAVTAILNVKLNILNLLASILTMIALYSVNLRIMGRPNIALLSEETVLTPWYSLGLEFHQVPVILFLIVVAVSLVLLWRFMKSETGLAMRATGSNARMARAQGIATGGMIILGVALSNGLVGLAGALFAQSQGAADVTMGVGVIVIGLASLIGGEAVLTPSTVMRALLACVIGAIIYRLAIAFALNADVLGLQAQDLNLITAVLVTLAIVLPGVRTNLTNRFTRKKA